MCSSAKEAGTDLKFLQYEQINLFGFDGEYKGTLLMHKILDQLIGRLPVCNPSFTSDFVYPFSGERRRDASGIHFEGPLGSCHPEYPVEISQNLTTQS